ncbi:hypothetical protein [Streptomyces sp. NPDC001914]|uniref:hypothetical protein n=1 Tax=Streptomyces sp. NPDC001914 TaxID=3364623 RepID=UPI00369A3384
MDELTKRVREIGARRLRLKADLATADSELRDVLPLARAGMTHAEIRSATGLDVGTIRIWTRA